MILVEKMLYEVFANTDFLQELQVKIGTTKDAVDDSGNLLPDSDRLTGFDQFLRSASIDELSELLSVLKGDMSLVGPRPLLMEYLPLDSPEQTRRHEVRPGITGWAHINGRNSITWKEKFNVYIWLWTINCYG